jgi:hypothetical protein
MGLTAAPHQLAGWTPIEVRWNGSRSVVRWCFTDGVEFTDPFFDQTIERCLRDPFRLLFWRETDISALGELASLSPGLTPCGFIFHMSRCGSTLVSQMLAELPDALVVSEAGPIDAVLRAQTGRSDIAESEVVERLRWMVSAVGQRRRAEQTRLVVKFDAWAILQLPLIRAAFPDTSCLFVYRDPVEVVVSHLGHRGYHMIPGTLPPGWFGLTSRQARSLSSEQYFATVLGRLCDAALAAARDEQLTLLDYDSLPEAVSETVTRLFGIDVGEPELAALAEVAGRDAKNPVVPFFADAADKQRRATPAARAAVDAHVAPVYAALENLGKAGRDRS